MKKSRCFCVSLIIILGLAPSVFAGIVTSGLIQDLDAEVGITASGTEVTAWANQAPSGGDDVSTNQGSPQLVPGPNGRAAVSLSNGACLAGTDESAFDGIMQGSGHTWFALIKPDIQSGDQTKNAVFGTLLGQSPWSGVVGHVSGTAAPLVANYLVRDTSDIFATGTTDLYDGEWHIIGGRLAAGTGDDVLAELFVDEIVAETSGAASVPGTSDCGELTIGAERTGGGEAYDGALARLLIYDRPLSDSEINQTMSALWLAEPNPRAWVPDPADGGLHTSTWANVSWRAGGYAVSHDVYFSDNFDDVDSGAESAFQGSQTDTFFVVGFPGFAYPDGLVPGTTYYWRIDEVNDTEPNSPWKGDVWSFAIPPKTAYAPDPADGTESVGIDAALGWTAGFGAKLHTVYFGESIEEVDDATDGKSQGITTYTPGTLKMAKTYYWRVDEFDIVETHKGDVWSFTTEGAVSVLDPANGAVDVTQTPVLTWAPGLGASHEIFFGTGASSLEKRGSGNLGSESYEPGQLEWNTTYYWRIDEANNANADSPWTGPLWSFTTANFLIIDDMESYNDLDPADSASNRIFNAWIDGFNDLTNGSLVGYEFPPFTEQTLVHSGLQSMPFEYDNSAGKSEATLALTSNRDWTVNGVNTLTIWFRGSSSNTAETMYVTLNGTARVDNDNPDAPLANSWTVWNIDLSRFADQGVDLTNVDTITLGLSSVTGGTGMLFFDDIRLHPPAQ